MISTIFNYLSLLALISYAVLLLKEELHMMQLNSYFNSRYLKWLKGNFISRYDIPKVLIILNGMILCFIHILPLQISVVIISAWGIFKLMRFKAKKKLDFTQRAIRLFVVELLLLLVFAASLYFLSDTIETVLLFLTLSIAFSFLVILFSVILTKPIENLINQWYINDARKKITQYSSLIRIGITGSYGKTSVKHFLHSILSEKYNVLMTPGSYNTTLGVVRTIREFLQPAHEVFIIEMGAKRIGDIKEICDLVSPKYSILTAIGPQHLETFGSLENVAKAKFEIIECLSSDGIGFVNFDNTNAGNIPAGTKGKVISFAVYSDAVYTAKNILYKGIGMTFDIHKNGEKIMNVETRLLGEHNVSNLLACCGVALELKLEKYQIEKAIKSIEAVTHRLEVKKLPNGITVIDDAFNSNPVGSKMAVEALKRFEGKRKIVITPGMIELGAKEFELNFEFGKLIAANCDIAVLVGVQRTKPIQEGISSTSFMKDNMIVCKNLSEANEKVKALMKEGDVILYENDLPDTFNE